MITNQVELNRRKSEMITNQVELNDVHNSVEPIFENLLNHLTEVEVDEVTGNARNYSISTDTDDVANIIAAHGRMYETLRELLPSKLDQVELNDVMDNEKLMALIQEATGLAGETEPEAAIILNTLHGCLLIKSAVGDVVLLRALAVMASDVSVLGIQKAGALQNRSTCNE